MAEKQRDWRNILQTLNDSELMKYYRFHRAVIMIVVDLISDVLISPSQCSNALTPANMETLFLCLQVCHS